MGKAVVAAISLILVVGAVIGAVVIVKQHNKNGTATSSSPGGSNILTGMKAVDTFCSPAAHEDLCKETLSPLAKDGANPTPKDFLEASFQATVKAVVKALEESKTLDKDAKDKFDVTSLQVCKEYMGYAIEDLEDAIAELSKRNMATVGDLARELNIWLSAVLAYQTTCIEEMENPKLKSSLKYGVLKNTTQLVENGLGILEGITQFLDTFNLDLSDSTSKIHNRQLMSVGKDGYPTWLSASDRKLLQAKEKVTPNVVVAKDGSGQFTTITEALKSYPTRIRKDSKPYPKKHQGRYIIYVKKGIYEEYVNVTSEMINIFMYGDGPMDTIVTGNRSYSQNIQTSQSGTFTSLANNFMAKDMGFHNTAGSEGHQAVALTVRGDRSTFYNCHMDGYQDTLYYWVKRSFYRDCIITGTVDFIFGKGAAVIQNSEIIARMPGPNQFNCITADGKNNMTAETGVVIQNCVIKGEPALLANNKIKTYLGRPWGPYATTVIMESELPGFISPLGYNEWNASSNHLSTAKYKEFANRGPGANTAARINKPGFAVVTDRKEVEKFTAGAWLKGQEWLPETGEPFYLGFST